jgi:hypothetical protein
MSTMQELVGMSVGLLTLMICLYLGPGIGDKISTAVPVNKSGDFANATTGASVWNSGVSILGVVVLVSFVALAIRSLKGIQGGNDQ